MSGILLSCVLLCQAETAAPTAETSATEARPYVETIPGTDVSFSMTPIPGGRFTMGSPEDEDDRDKDEGPQREVEVSPFWMGVHEVTWDEFHLFMYQLDVEAREEGAPLSEADRLADAVSRPTPPYVPMDFDMGTEGTPAISMTQFAARHYTKWLSKKTGRVYRLPTEAEWEYACRAGTTGPYSFDADAIDEHAWYFDNADDTYQVVGQKEPNAFGLYDMHGNVAEWVLDGWSKEGYPPTEDGAILLDPVVWPTAEYGRVVRGGSWDDDPEDLRSAARRASSRSWKVRDPQIPRSVWYLTDAAFVGFRLVRPLEEPDEELRARYWEPDLDATRDILDKQRKSD